MVSHAGLLCVILCSPVCDIVTCAYSAVFRDLNHSFYECDYHLLCCMRYETVVLCSVCQGLNHSFYECDHHLWRLGGRKLPRGIAIGETRREEAWDGEWERWGRGL